MKHKFSLIITAITFFIFPNVNFAQAPPLGTAADFVLFSTVGAVSNTGITHLTGNVGTNSGSSTGFGNVDGQMHDNDGVSAQCAADLMIAYNQLNVTVPTFFPAPLLGNGQILNAGVYSIPSPATMNLDLILDGQNNSTAVFIFQIQGSFSANANAKVKLINGALACNVFWKIEGLVSLASAVTMRGTVIANNAAINMSTGDTLEGRALSTTGAITVNGIMAYKPIGCGSPVLVGPVPPPLGATACYTLFSSIGPVTNVGVTFVTGDIGSDNGLTTGYNPLNVTGMIHPVPDASTAACASDLINVYNYLNLLPFDIELLYPAQFGNNLVLTPHTYRMNAACTFTDTLFLNAEGNADAVFVIQINGALSTSTYSKVVLQNGTQSKNVYWKVEGAVSINDYSIFCGTIICNNGAINLNTGVTLDGRALTTTGAVNTSAINAVAPSVSGPAGTIVGPATVCAGDTGVVFTVPAIPNATSYIWTLSPGATITAGANTNSITVDFGSGAVTGNVTVQGSSSCGSGTVSANFTVTVNPLPIVTASSTSNSVCSGGSVTLTGGGASTYVWTGGVSDGISFNPTLSTTYIVTGTDGNNCSDTASILVSISAGPNVTALASSTTVCVGDSVTLNGSGALTYVWTGGVLDGITFLPGATTTYTVTGTDINNCSDTATATVIVNAQPIVTATASANSICPGDSVTLNGGGATTYSWSGGVLNGVSFIPASTTTYTVTGSNGNNCSDTATITIQLNPSPAAVASGNSPVCLDSIINLGAQIVLNGTYNWAGPNSFSSSDQNPVIVSAAFAFAGTYTLTVTSNGCTSTPATVIVIVNDCNVPNSDIDFHIPDGFSPNGDGINDLFVIRGIEYFPENTFSIYNRWGNKVFEANPYQNTWDGTATMGLTVGGDQLPVGTYFYVLDLNDGTPVYKGNIYLNR